MYKYKKKQQTKVKFTNKKKQQIVYKNLIIITSFIDEQKEL